MKRVVVVGGGTGVSTALRGLKQYTYPTAIVSMMDNGGSSGRLRDEYDGLLPPGDITRCIWVLSDNNDLKKECDYRIREGEEYDAVEGVYKILCPLTQRHNGVLFDKVELRGRCDRLKDNYLVGHTIRNLVYTVLYQLTKNNNEVVIRLLHDLFETKGRAHPVTLNNVHLDDMLEDGTIIRGEKNIDVPKHNPKLKIEKIWLNPDAFAYAYALKAIEQADVIGIGPGDIYTSVIPNFLVKGIVESIRESKAKKVYICNLMTKNGETNGFKASDHVREIEKYLGEGTVDYVICNTKKPSEELLDLYEKENRFFVEPDLNGGRYNVLEDCLLNEKNWGDGGNLIRHHPTRLAKLIMGI